MRKFIFKILILISLLLLSITSSFAGSSTLEDGTMYFTETELVPVGVPGVFVHNISPETSEYSSYKPPTWASRSQVCQYCGGISTNTVSSARGIHSVLNFTPAGSFFTKINGLSISAGKTRTVAYTLPSGNTAVLPRTSFTSLYFIDTERYTDGVYSCGKFLPACRNDLRAYTISVHPCCTYFNGGGEASEGALNGVGTTSCKVPRYCTSPTGSGWSIKECTVQGTVQACATSTYNYIVYDYTPAQQITKYVFKDCTLIADLAILYAHPTRNVPTLVYDNKVLGDTQMGCYTDISLRSYDLRTYFGAVGKGTSFSPAYGHGVMRNPTYYDSYHCAEGQLDFGSMETVIDGGTYCGSPAVVVFLNFCENSNNIKTLEETKNTEEENGMNKLVILVLVVITVIKITLFILDWLEVRELHNISEICDPKTVPAQAIKTWAVQSIQYHRHTPDWRNRRNRLSHPPLPRPP